MELYQVDCNKKRITSTENLKEYLSADKMVLGRKLKRSKTNDYI